MDRRPRTRNWPQICAYAAALLIVNVLVSRGLFSEEYSAYLSSNEGTFIALARQVAAHPRDFLWWPLWDCGLPFQNTYLPLLPGIVGGFAALTGQSASLAFHQVAAAFFCIGPVSLFLMAWVVSERRGTSFLAALAYSIVSPSAILLPTIANELGSIWRLRRLQILVYYGEGPSNSSMALLPLAVLFLYLALRRQRLWMKIAAGMLMAATVLANAFGATILAMVVLSLLFTIETQRFWRNTAMLAIVGAFAYCWILPLVPPSVIAAIRVNSPTIEGDYRFTLRSFSGVLILAAGFVALGIFLRAIETRPEIRFFALFAFLTTSVVMLGYLAHVYVLPQPHRYQNAMDLSLCMVLVFGVREVLDRYLPKLKVILAVVLLLGAVVQTRNEVRYARGLIRSVDMKNTAPYKIAMWMDGHMRGQRIMVGGAYSFQFNDFTDTPQLHGGHEPMLPNLLLRHVTYQIYSGVGAGTQEGNIATLWLHALGAHAISVPGPKSEEFYKPFQNPRKFDDILPVLWREGDDTIYGVPARSESLAHVIPAAALVSKEPVSGLDVEQTKVYVTALEDPSIPIADWRWTTPHSGVVQAVLGPQQAVSVQITCHPGWHAAIDGVAQKIRGDGLGFIVIEPTCQGPCTIELTYDGGAEWRIGLLISGCVTLLCIFLLIRQLLSRLAAARGLKPV